VTATYKGAFASAVADIKANMRASGKTVQQLVDESSVPLPTEVIDALRAEEAQERAFHSVEESRLSAAAPQAQVGLSRGQVADARALHAELTLDLSANTPAPQAIQTMDRMRAAFERAKVAKLPMPAPAAHQITAIAELVKGADAGASASAKALLRAMHEYQQALRA
jgi:hypothetical protein